MALTSKITGPGIGAAAASALAPAALKLLDKLVNDKDFQDRLKPLVPASPATRLARQIDATLQLTDMLIDPDTGTVVDAAQVKAWHDRAVGLRSRLALPVTTSKSAHLRQIRTDLRALHTEINTALTHPSADSGS
ncbi:hypothetical protein [Arsenicicoccus dermatophilus]|uniref:hypothetical protein n=1 Tax=Arsenicicoccus dermatophilus TaxID=1076331 RepID=UPI001F4CE2C5|nr:hypothetical protein [Arsenicicoccus dermatophilus]MCH8614399.1 hypothetical protein [Arsenicicoccus dermatophilus]